MKQVFFPLGPFTVFSSWQITTTVLYSYMNGKQIRMSILASYWFYILHSIWGLGLTPAQAMNSLVHLPVKAEIAAAGASKNRLHRNKAFSKRLKLNYIGSFKDFKM